MECPYCSKEISDLALVCGLCGKRIPVKVKVKRERRPIAGTIKGALLAGRDEFACAWTLLDVAFLSILIYAFVFHHPFRLDWHIIRFAKLHLFMFTKEPMLYAYLKLFTGTIILKLIALAAIVVLVKARKVSFLGSIFSGGKSPLLYLKWLPLYLVACVILRLPNISNPYVPKIPFSSPFGDALIFGNAAIIISSLFFAPIVEEIIFRGFIFPAFNKRVGLHLSVLLTSVLFTFAHFPHIQAEISYMASVFILSVIITYAKAGSRSTILAIIMHHIYNLIFITVG